MKLAQWKMRTKVGSVYLVASPTGLQSLTWTIQKAPMAKSLVADLPEIKILSRAVLQLTEYLDGNRKSFDLPLDAEGTDFQKLVWARLIEIPYGETASYKDIAGKIKNEKAVRAVGTANGKNPLCIIVPCHRVIASNGNLAGYVGGVENKKILLDLEKRV